MIRPMFACAALMLSLAACSQAPGSGPQTAISPQLDSGISSSNGGAIRALNAAPNVGIGGGAPASSNSRGSAY